MYLHDELVFIMMDEIQENLFKVNMSTKRVTHYDDKQPIDDFLQDFYDSETAIFNKDFYEQNLQYALENIDNDDWYIAVHDVLKNKEDLKVIG